MYEPAGGGGALRVWLRCEEPTVQAAAFSYFSFCNKGPDANQRDVLDTHKLVTVLQNLNLTFFSKMVHQTLNALMFISIV